MALFKRFPSYEYLASGTGKAFLRFPLTLISAFVASAATVILIEYSKNGGHSPLEKVAILAGLGISLFTALALFGEKLRWSRPKSLILQSLGAAFLIGLYFSMPLNVREPYFYPARLALLAVTFHFLVAFLPWLGGEQGQGFWQYNKSLFLRFLTAALYSAVLYVGLAIALLAADKLFNFKVEGETYFQLWVIIAGVFNTWMFLAGIPGDLERLNDVTDYPKGLRMFAQYVLLPLVGLYLVILYAYELKIIFTWNWPKGWVSHLVLWYSVVSILSLLLLWPLRNQTENRWIRTFSTWFFRLLIPLIVMLFLAILERVGDYGLTVNRYFVLAMAIGLTVVVLYFVFSRKKDIRIIPIVVCLIALLSAYGPWSAFAVSKRSQSARLSTLLLKYELPRPAVLAAADIPFGDRQEMSSITRYLADWHGARSFSLWLPESTLVSLDTLSQWLMADSVASRLGFEYVEHWNIVGEFSYFNFTAMDSSVSDISGYNHMVMFQSWGGNKELPLQVGGDSCTIRLQDSAATVIITLLGRSHDSVAIDLSMALDSLTQHQRNGQVSRDQLTFESVRESIRAKLICESVAGQLRSDSIIVSSIRGWVLLTR